MLTSSRAAVALGVLVVLLVGIGPAGAEPGMGPGPGAGIASGVSAKGEHRKGSMLAREKRSVVPWPWTAAGVVVAGAAAALSWSQAGLSARHRGAHNSFGPFGFRKNPRSVIVQGSPVVRSSSLPGVHVGGNDGRHQMDDQGT